MTSRWEQTDAPRGDEYDERWRKLAAAGENVHGEADLVSDLVAEYGVARSVLDAGCGTGRVAIELRRRGFDVVGVDLDERMLARARDKQPDIEWCQADLATISLGRCFGAAVLAGNVMIFLAPGTERDVLARIAQHLDPGGLVIAGFQVRPDRLPLVAYDDAAAAAGCEFVDRFATWDRAPDVDGDYAVSVHRRR
jgi:SAM-dependent methyltransferase